MRKFNLAIITNERPDDHELWEAACNQRKEELNYTIIDLTKRGWYENIVKGNFDYLLVKPSGQTNMYKQLFDERLMVLTNELKIPAFPTLNEVLIYENKRYFSFWLKANNIPHPETNVFYNKSEAINFINNTKYPLVAKLNIGASGSGVEVLRSTNEAMSYVEKIFTSGISSKTGPNFSKGKILKRLIEKIKNPQKLLNRIKIYKAISGDVQKGYTIFQEFIPHDFEWRVVRIGNSFFAHKKLIKKDKASGSLLKGYDNPPIELFDFVKEITDRFGFYSQAVDLFEVQKGQYLVNEMQCIFGQSDPYQMLVDGKPGRYLFEKGNWVFEEGTFNQNQSFNLRMDHVLKKLKSS